MKITRCIRVLMMGVIWSFRAQAVGIPHFKVDDAVRSADLIVVADVNEVRDLGPAPPIQVGDQRLQARAYSADLLVRRTLKGPTLNEIDVTYSLPRTFVGYSGLKRGTRLIFLHRYKDRYHLVSSFYSNFPATLEDPGGNLASEQPSELVMCNILAVLASQTASSADKYEILRIDYALPNNGETITALQNGLKATSDRELYERLQGQLISLCDLSKLPEAVSLLSEDLATKGGTEWLLYAIGNHVKDVRAVQMLEPLLRSSDDSVREAAVEALWHIGSPSAAAALVEKLDDPDEKVRFYAVRGLSDIGNQYGWGGPAEGEFQDHEQKYLTHWQEWAKKRADHP